MKTPQEAVQKWMTGMQSAGPAYQAGIQGTTVSPGQLASAAAGLWVTNVTAAQQRFAAKTAAVTLAQWQSASINKGLPRLIDGATNAQTKMTAFFNAFMPAVSAMVAQLPPRGTYTQNRTRATAMMDALHNAKGSF